MVGVNVLVVMWLLEVVLNLLCFGVWWVSICGVMLMGFVGGL